MTLFAGSAPFGAALAGYLSDVFSAPASIILGGIVAVVIAVILFTTTQLGQPLPEAAIVRER